MINRIAICGSRIQSQNVHDFSCDLAIRADGQCEATDVLLCPVYTRSDLTTHPTFRRDAVWEKVRKAGQPTSTTPRLARDRIQQITGTDRGPYPDVESLLTRKK